MAVLLLDNCEGYYECDETSGARIDETVNGLDFAETGFVGSVTGKTGLAIDGTGSTSNFLDRASTSKFQFPDKVFR